MEPIEAAGIRHKAGTFRLEHLPHRPLALFGMVVGLRICDAAVKQPSVV